MKIPTTTLGRFASLRLNVVGSLLAGLLLSCSISPILLAQDSSQKLPTEAAQRETWRKSMARHPVPDKGCFHAAYPDTEWREDACAPASPYPNPPAGLEGFPGFPATEDVSNTVGDIYGDFTAVTTHSLFSAEGAFMSVNGAASVSGDVLGTPPPMSNVFMLQLNSNFFSTPVCASISGCLGWQQFLYSQTQCGGSACVFMEYWLLNYGATCPAGPWISYYPDCWFNGPATLVPAQTVANLAAMKLTASANSITDTATVYAPSTATLYSASGSDGILDISFGTWNTAEFNVFGDCCATETSFSAPTTIDVKTTIDDGTTNAPLCVNQSFTAETNNLTLANLLNSQPALCCPYGGATPAIEFMETNSSLHTAMCGATQLWGDVHLVTANSTRYNFQGAGEFVSLEDADGMEVQTRQTPVATSSFPILDSYDGLASCVAINTAVAARVGQHRVTYEPNLDGSPDPGGLQLRIDGALITLPATGISFGAGADVLNTSSPGGIEVDFSDGKSLVANPAWWPAESLWYLDVYINNVGVEDSAGSTGAFPAGLVAPIAAGSWLPALPGGASVGPMPGTVPAVYNTLYNTFGNAWRVTNASTLFDYGTGQSTATFTNLKWPQLQGPCNVSNETPVNPISATAAIEDCKAVTDPTMNADCVFDVQVTGFTGFVEADEEGSGTTQGGTKPTQPVGTSPTQPVSAGNTVRSTGITNNDLVTPLLGRK